jgi:hypothetical protein
VAARVSADDAVRVDGHRRGRQAEAAEHAEEGRAEAGGDGGDEQLLGVGADAAAADRRRRRELELEVVGDDPTGSLPSAARPVELDLESFRV